MTDRRRNVRAFAALCGILVIVAVATTIVAARKGPPRGAATVSAPATSISTGDLLFRTTALDRTFGHLALTSGGAGPDSRLLAALSCVRVDFAAGRGVCLSMERRGFLSGYSALVFDKQFNVLRSVALAGRPSRVRVSPDGKMAATTVFVTGDSYATVGFSTRTTLLDLEAGTVVADLERFTTFREGQVITAVDLNFWGVTFASNHNEFFATLGTGGRTYLVRGDVAARRVETLRENVECPSLSPDGRLVAFKKAVNSGIGPVRWRLSVLDLETMREWPLAETRSVDDQVAWLDQNHILYALTSDGDPLPSTDNGQSSIETNTWVVEAGGGGAPRLFLSGASTATIIR